MKAAPLIVIVMCLTGLGLYYIGSMTFDALFGVWLGSIGLLVIMSINEWAGK